MELKDTIVMMTSDDYKERFKAEYYQLKIRFDKLNAMCEKYAAGKLDFQPACSLGLLMSQAMCMKNYLNHLEMRAESENIDLTMPQAGT